MDTSTLLSIFIAAWFLIGTEVLIRTRGKLGYSKRMLDRKNEIKFWQFALVSLTGPFSYFLYRRRLQKDGGRWEYSSIENWENIRDKIDNSTLEISDKTISISICNKAIADLKKNTE